MDGLLKDFQIPMIIKPGEVYIFTEDEHRDCQIDSLDFAYMLRTDEEIPLALEMETGKVLKEIFEFKEFLGYKRISEESHVFRFLYCDRREKKDRVYSLYLHRMNTFQDKLAAVNEWERRK